MGAVVGAPGAALRRHARGRARAAAAARRAQLQLPRLRPPLQAQVVAAQPPEVGVRQGTAVPVPLLRVPRQAEDAHRAPHGAHAPRSAPQARAVPQAGQRRRLHVARARALWPLRPFAPSPLQFCHGPLATFDSSIFEKKYSNR